MPRLVRYEYRRPGKEPTYYEEWLIVDRADVKVLLLDPYVGKAVRVEGRPILDPGAPIVWYVFPGRWYDIGRFHRADGTLTGWYTNLCRPAVTHGERWIGEDLFLDHWQWVDGSRAWLDEDELADAVRDGWIDHDTLARIELERQEIERFGAVGAWPPAIAREIDLAEARRLASA